MKLTCEKTVRPHARPARPRRTWIVLLATACAALALPGSALAAGSGGIGDEIESGSETPGTPQPPAAPAGKAKLVDGRAVAPSNAPPKVVRALAAANRIVSKPYCYGGGHSAWQSRCYDCSGTVSYALGAPGAGILEAPMPSGSFVGWAKPGRGRWITVYANGGHMYAVIAGLRLDTSMTPGDGPGWSKGQLHQTGFSVRHPRGL